MDNKSFNKNSNLDYIIKSIYAFIIAALIVKLFFSNIWGTGVIGLGLMALIIILFTLISKREMQKEFIHIFKLIIKNGMPLIIFMSIVIWLFSLYLLFNNKIVKEQIPKSFYTFSSISTVLIILQLLVLYKFLMDQLSLNNNNNSENLINTIYNLLSSQIISLLYLLSLFNFIITGFLQVILKYFTTDG